MHARHRNMAPFIITASLILSTSALARPTATQSGMAVSAHPLASQAGAEILRAGGNAADAAAAVALALAVVEPYSSGLGGGGFALVRMGEELTFMDFRETAPKAAPEIAAEAAPAETAATAPVVPVNIVDGEQPKGKSRRGWWNRIVS